MFRRVLVGCYDNLRTVPDTTGQEERAESLKALMMHIDEVASRIYFALDIDSGLRMPEGALNEDQRRQLYFEVKPLGITKTTALGNPPKFRLIFL